METDRTRIDLASRRTIHTGLSLAVALLFLAPIGWTVTTSLRPTGSVPPRSIEWLPSRPAWTNYRDVFAVVELGRFIANSLFVVALAVPLTILFASLAGFAIAQASRRWRTRLILVSVLAMMVPLTVIWLPRFILLKEAGLMNRRLALVVPALMGTSPLYVLLFAWAFQRVSRDVYDAARLDGAGPAGIWAQIALPLARPAVVSVAVLSFVHYWNSFVEPLLYLRDVDKMTAALGLRVLYQLDRTNWPLMMAGALIVTAPVIVVFVAAQRVYFQDERGYGVLGR